LRYNKNIDLRRHYLGWVDWPRKRAELIRMEEELREEMPISEVDVHETVKDVFNAEAGTYWAAIRDFAYIVVETPYDSVEYGGTGALKQMVMEKVMPTVRAGEGGIEYTRIDAGEVSWQLMQMCRTNPRET
jgi:hypothetical protein